MVLAGLLIYFAPQLKNSPNQKKLNVASNNSQEFGPVKVKKAIFIPYWAIGENHLNIQDYDELIYFGVLGNLSGIEEEDQGFQSLEKFVQETSSSEISLAVRMTDSETNLTVLNNKDSQEKIINQSVEIAKKYGFSKVILDFELFSLFDDTIPLKINTFVANFYKQAKQNNLGFALTIYGDTFYRKRPYDLKTLAKYSDEILIMAYDLHKSIGEPGPNFPLEGRKKYGYDFKSMINDFTKVIPREKIGVIFGMYGYDWTVNEKKIPLKQATALSLNQIREKYISNCQKTNCVLKRDPKSQETEIDFVIGPKTLEEFSENHIIWFEDERSAAAKQDYLKKQGIGNFSYWTYGYF